MLLIGWTVRQVTPVFTQKAQCGMFSMLSRYCKQAGWFIDVHVVLKTSRLAFCHSLRVVHTKLLLLNFHILHSLLVQAGIHRSHNSKC